MILNHYCDFWFKITSKVLIFDFESFHKWFLIFPFTKKITLCLWHRFWVLILNLIIFSIAVANAMPIHHIFYILVTCGTLVETRANRVKVEALNFLDDRSKVLQTISCYSNVCSTFLKYNTSLPSSAPLERLFSIGGLILTPWRNKLSDAAFQQLLTLNTNSSVVNM